MLPLADAQWTDEHDERAARSEMLFEPGLPGLAGGKAVAVEEGVETRLVEPRPQRLRRGCVRPRVAQKDVVVSGSLAHEVTIHNWTGLVTLRALTEVKPNACRLSSARRCSKPHRRSCITASGDKNKAGTIHAYLSTSIRRSQPIMVESYVLEGIGLLNYVTDSNTIGSPL